MSIFGKIRSFIGNMMDEMRKCTWPTRDQLLESTLLVLISLLIVSLYVSGIDQILSKLIKFLISY